MKNYVIVDLYWEYIDSCDVNAVYGLFTFEEAQETIVALEKTLKRDDGHILRIFEIEDIQWHIYNAN